jgi:hypothetical protein
VETQDLLIEDSQLIKEALNNPSNNGKLKRYLVNLNAARPLNLSVLRATITDINKEL